MAKDADPMLGLRADIDAIDDNLLKLLNDRAQIAEKVAAAKAAKGGITYVPGRERQIVDRLQSQNAGPFPNDAIRPVFQEVISACLRLQKGLRVAYLGPEATFTHQAVKRQFGSSALTIPCGSIGAVFQEVTRGQADVGVVPVENSTEGIVNHTLDSFVESSLRIRAEIVVPVVHTLMARAGVELAAIERVYSHPQALGQCRTWLRNNMPKVSLVSASSTADAARTAHGDSKGGAIASELAARLYGLSVLRSGLQDVSDNVTRFLVVGDAKDAAPEKGKSYKTSVALAFPDAAGGLFRILKPLSDAGVNLTKIESRPSRKGAWAYVFFLDLDGHAEDGELAPVLKKVEASCDMFRVLGSYRKADVL